MSTATATLDTLVGFLRSLDNKTKSFIFEKVFIVSDTSLLSPAESKSLEKGLSEYRQGKAIK
jgi:hypothetical protein